jgi:hypothetical protein
MWKLGKLGGIAWAWTDDIPLIFRAWSGEDELNHDMTYECVLSYYLMCKTMCMSKISRLTISVATTKLTPNSAAHGRTPPADVRSSDQINHVRCKIACASTGHGLPRQRAGQTLA